MQGLVRHYTAVLDSAFRLLDVTLSVVAYFLLVARHDTPAVDAGDMTLMASVALLFTTIGISAGL